MTLTTMTAPSAQQQLQFLKQVQQILQAGSFTSTYKFALLISLCRLAIEKGRDTGEVLELGYTDIAEKFIGLYWKQAMPFDFNQYEPMVLQQSHGSQAAMVKLILEAQAKFKTIAKLRQQPMAWQALLKAVAATVKKMPVQYLQNLFKASGAVFVGFARR